MSEFSRSLIASSGYERQGFAEEYDRYRPAPPGELLDMLCALAGVERPRLVVDLGCGTGLSTRAWSGRAARVIGVEANEHMLAVARRAGEAEYLRALAADTGLPSGEADLVTCAQAFHWMDPRETLPEAARLLRSGGVFAAYDYDPLPVIEPSVDEAFNALAGARGAARQRLNLLAGAATWPKERHLDEIRACGFFATTRELVAHSRLELDSDGIVGLSSSLGGPLELFDEAPAVREAHERLRDVAGRVVGAAKRPVFLCYRIRAGVR